MRERTFDVRSPEELEAVAAAMAGGLVAGDRIALLGELGAGKTVFVRGLARGLGVPDLRDVVSPTFAIHNRYEGGRLVLDHLDVYRLPAPVAMAREGLDPVVDDPSGVLCCEWADRLSEPLAGLVAEITLLVTGEETRRAVVRVVESAAERLLPTPP